MQRWRRFLWAILALPVLVILNATPGRGADWRLAAAVWTAQMLYFIAPIAGFFWLVEPVLRVQDQVGHWLALVVFGILGAFLELVALAVFLHVAVLLWRGRRTTATVVSDTNPSDDTKFQFSDQSGHTHLVSGPVSSAHRAYGAGQQVPLIYLPGRPGTFVVDRFGDKWGVPLFFFVLGLLILFPWAVFAFDLEQSIRARPSVFASLICLTVGVIFSALGFTFAVKAVRFRRRAVKAVGIIVEAKSLREAWAERRRKEGGKLLTELPDDADESQRWAITVEFADATRSRRRGSAELWTCGTPQVGEQVPIWYDPERPWDIRTVAFMSWLGSLVVGALGAVFVATGVVLWIVGIS